MRLKIYTLYQNMRKNPVPPEQGYIFTVIYNDMLRNIALIKFGDATI